MRNVLMLSAGAMMLTLAACDKGAEPAADGNSGPAAGANTSQSVEQVAAEMKKISLQPGEWETSFEILDVKMEGGPQGMPERMVDAMKAKRPPIKTCITPEQAAKPDADFLTAQKDSKCSYSGFHMAGGAIEGTVTCPSGQGGESKVAMQGIYTPTTYTVTMEMDAAGMNSPSGGAMTMHMKAKTTGKRVGECKAN